MRSWELFTRLNPFREPDGAVPVFLREATHLPPWRVALQLIGRSMMPSAGVLALVAVLVALRAPLPLATRCLTGGLSLLVMVLASLVTWSVPLGVALGPTIVREREGGTWDTLRTTPFDTATLVLSKARGALWSLRVALLLARDAVLIAALAAALLSLSLIEHTPWPALTDLSPYQACGVGLLVMAAGGCFYLLDRAQQFTLMATAALAVSAGTRTVRVAVPGANAAAFVFWLLDVSLAAVVLTLQPAQAATLQERVITLTLLGPIPAYLAELSLGWAALAVTITLALREALIALVWRWTLRAASA